MSQSQNVIIKLATLYCLCFFSMLGSANAITNGVQLQSHRAVYELSLGDSDTFSGINGILGTIEYDFSGSECDGFTTNVIYLINILYENGNTAVLEINTSTYENLKERSFQFAHKTALASQEIENVRGLASRNGGEIVVDLQYPKQEKQTIKSDALFPTEHILKTIEMAKSGKNFFSIDTFDGSEDGKKIYDTSTIIGIERDLTLDGFEDLAGIRYWPVTFAYFEQDQEQRSEQTPASELLGNLHENGVHSEVLFKFSEYSMNGKLVELEYYTEPEC